MTKDASLPLPMLFHVEARDDSGCFLPACAEKEIIKQNPFATIDQAGIGKLMKIAVELGRQTRPDSKLGICGEHGGEPAGHSDRDFDSQAPLRLQNGGQIIIARQAFNDSVMAYNNDREIFPSNLIANMFNFSPAELFVIDKPEQKDAPKVSFS